MLFLQLGIEFMKCNKYFFTPRQHASVTAARGASGRPSPGPVQPGAGGAAGAPHRPRQGLQVSAIGMEIIFS